MRLEGLQLARGLAAMLVVLHHIEGKLEVARPDAPLFLHGGFSGGWVGVDFFFVLSGFIIALTLSARPSVGGFLKRRFARVHVPFWVAFGLTLVGAMLSPSTRVSLQGFSITEWLLALALLPSGQSAPVIGVAWTLHHEILFYLLASLWLVRPLWCAGLATACLVGSMLVGASAPHPLGFLFSPLHWEFLFGALAFCLHSRISPTWAWSALIAGASWIGAWSIVAPAANQTDDPARVIQHGVGMALICLGLAALELGRQRAGKAPTSAAFAKLSSALGDWSYGLYLIHIPIILAVIKAADKFGALGNGAPLQLVGLVCFLTCLLASKLFHERVEKPLVRQVNLMLGPRSRA